MCLLQRFLIAEWSDTCAEIISNDTTTHATVDEEADTTKHLLLADRFTCCEKFANPLRQSFVKGHGVRYEAAEGMAGGIVSKAGSFGSMKSQDAARFVYTTTWGLNISKSSRLDARRNTSPGMPEFVK